MVEGTPGKLEQGRDWATSPSGFEVGVFCDPEQHRQNDTDWSPPTRQRILQKSSHQLGKSGIIAAVVQMRKQRLGGFVTMELTEDRARTGSQAQNS